MFSKYKALDFNKVYLRKVASFLKSLENKENLNLLDIGCADGSFSKYLKDLGFKVCGIDISPEAINNAKKIGIDACVHDVSKKFPFENCFFDIVVMMEVIEHVYDTDFLLDEIKRILKKEGLLIITTPNLGSFENRIRLLTGKYPRLVEYRIGSNCSGHIRNYTKSVLISQLEEHNFKVMKSMATNIPFPVYSKFPRMLKEIAIKLGDLEIFSSLGYQMIIISKKIK
jgi:2-polyprenyl-3-methyl-5-hydroxy-6-metoxy-1,4-benzoquinol methylase